MAVTPYLMHTLALVGTAAMFIVGGSIIGHDIPFLHHVTELVTDSLRNLSAIGGTFAIISPNLIDSMAGLIVGAICVGLFEIINKVCYKQ